MSPPLIHPQALVESAAIGDDTRIWAFAHVQPDVVIGAGCNVGDHCFIERGVRIGNDVVIKNGVSVWAGVTIEDQAFIGPNACFTNDTIPRAKAYHATPEATHVGRGASIGANATLLSGISVGAHALVGAGAVVTKSVPPFGVVAGNPAHLRGYRCACGRRLPSPGAQGTHKCECGRRFVISTASIQEVQ